MRTRPGSSSDTPVCRISGPAELLAAVPYLLGFHPHSSLVLVGLHGTRLVVTARLDLADARQPGAVEHTVSALVRGGSTSVVTAVYDDDSARTGAAAVASWRRFAADLADAVERAGCHVGDALLVSGRRWWSLSCTLPACCPQEGSELEGAASAFAATATYEGIVVQRDRAALAALLDPLPDDQRRRLQPAIAAEEGEAVQAAHSGGQARRERAVKRAVFASARAGQLPGRFEVADSDVVRFGVALSDIGFRDAVWLAVDDGRLDGRALWRELARRLPQPYDAPPLFLYGWACWRAGDGTQAGMAAERAIASDPGYTAADLLLAALSSGLSPRAMARLRRPA